MVMVLQMAVDKVRDLHHKMVKNLQMENRHQTEQMVKNRNIQ
jgi:hypothetical protein